MMFLTTSMFTFTVFSLALPRLSPGGLGRLDRRLLVVLRWRWRLGVSLAAVLAWSRICLTGVSLLTVVLTSVSLALVSRLPSAAAVLVARVLALTAVVRF